MLAQTPWSDTVIAAPLCGFAALIVAASLIAAARAPDVYLRIHAIKPVVLYAVPLLAAGLMAVAPSLEIATRLALLTLAIWIAGMQGLGMIAHAAHRAGEAFNVSGAGVAR